jgi:hypothetical protein
MELTPTLETAKSILTAIGLKGMHVKAIASEAVSKNQNMSLSVEEFQKRLQSALAANLKIDKPSFATVKWDTGPSKGKPKKGWYRLKIERIVTPGKRISPPITDKAFTGKAGEFAVMSELLFWEYNASIMSVDDGIDVIASKDNKYFHVQVKTAAEQDGCRFVFTIKHSSFKEHDSSAMFYVFVLRRSMMNEYIIIPSNFLRTLIAGGRINPSPSLSITITADPRGVKYLLNGSTDVSPYFGDFGSIIC